MDKFNVPEKLESKGLEKYTDKVEEAVHSLKKRAMGGEKEAAEGFAMVAAKLPSYSAKDGIEIMMEYISKSNEAGWRKGGIGVGTYCLAECLSEARSLPENVWKEVAEEVKFYADENTKEANYISYDATRLLKAATLLTENIREDEEQLLKFIKKIKKTCRLSDAEADAKRLLFDYFNREED